MKILVPYSGLGTNSTYGMYRWLTETDHEVVAMFLDIYYSSDEYTAFEREHFNKGVKWFKDNTRDFKTIERKCIETYSNVLVPLREGSPYKIDISRTSLSMKETYAQVAKEFDVDIISSGKSGEDTSGPLEMATSILKGSDYKSIHPSWSLTEEVTLENRDQVIKEMSSKWSQREKLPQGLRNIITDCQCKGKKIGCYFCSDLLLNELRPETGQELDDLILEKLCAGKFRHLADPKTFNGLRERTWRYLGLLGYNRSDDIENTEILEELSMKAQEMYNKAGNL
jgi:hypothetical protein